MHCGCNRNIERAERLQDDAAVVVHLSKAALPEAAVATAGSRTSGARR
jgi:hypothetical protein